MVSGFGALWISPVKVQVKNSGTNVHGLLDELECLMHCMKNIYSNYKLIHRRQAFWPL